MLLKGGEGLGPTRTLGAEVVDPGHMVGLNVVPNVLARQLSLPAHAAHEGTTTRDRLMEPEPVQLLEELLSPRLGDGGHLLDVLLDSDHLLLLQ
jgi:hypothetical protein